MGVSGQRHAVATLYRRGKNLRYPLDRRLGGPKTGLDTEAIGKILFPCWGSNPNRPVVHFFISSGMKFRNKKFLYVPVYAGFENWFYWNCQPMVLSIAIMFM
jgi:hypothetical protein